MKPLCRPLVAGTAVLLLAVVSLSAVPPAQALPYISRPEITARAESAMDSLYTWGKESWVPNSGATAGPDCSGLVLKAWEVPRSMLYQEEHGENAYISPRYSTYHFYNDLGPWYGISRGSLAEGDALVRRSGDSGHIVLYAGGDRWGYPVIYEAPYTGAAVRRVSRYIGDEYRAKRRYSISDSSILLDNPSAKSTAGSDVGGNWTRSTSVGGYYGDDYQTTYGTSARSYARWTPRLPSSRTYAVYLRWTSWPNRATNAKVTINTPGGQLVRYVNQRQNGSRWVYMGRYYFGAGYSTGSGSVSIHATGANGYVVADAALFSP